MSGDKRQVATDALETLGTIITEAEKRDAIHLAVEPVIAAHTLRPGEDVGFVDGGVGVCDSPVGIVDPFLKNAVRKGERFWLVVYPRKITSLRHVWEHPSFPGEVSSPPTIGHTKSELDAAAADIAMVSAQNGINEIADDLGVDPGELMQHARSYLKSGQYWSEGERFDGEYLPQKFWDHYEVVTGEKVPESERGSFFSCSC